MAFLIIQEWSVAQRMEAFSPGVGVALKGPTLLMVIPLEVNWGLETSLTI
jgi:hypothetical protein